MPLQHTNRELVILSKAKNLKLPSLLYFKTQFEA